MSISFTKSLSFFGLLLVNGALFGQSPSPMTQLKLVKNTSVQRVVQSHTPPVYKRYPAHGDLTKVLLPCPSNCTAWQLTYTPDAGFVGVDTFQIETTINGVAPVIYYEAFRASVYHSIVNAEADFASTAVNTPVTLPVLANDNTTAPGGLSVSSSPLKDHGAVVVNADNTVTFTPQSGYTGAAFFNYVVCDSLGTCETGSATVAVMPAQAAQNETVFVSTAKNARLSIPLKHSGYSIFQNPSHGTAVVNGGFLVDYNPANNFTGTDTLVAVNTSFGNPVFSTVIVSVLNFASANKYAIDDYAWTAKNVAVTLNVKANDLGYYNITGWIAPSANQGTILANPSVPGQVTFTPASNFSGVATFKYKVGNMWQNVVETGTVSVMVGNMNPSAATFHLTTPVDVPLVINYQIPFIGFDFAMQDGPDNGNVAIHQGFQTLTINGQTVSGNNLLVYTPDGGYSGEDEFDINYCVTSTGQCATVKVVVDVVEITSNPDEFCIADCVWAGDVNADGIVNNKDILPLGYWMGEGGTVRPNAVMEWYGQGAPDWANPYSNYPIDLKHVDTDGNGDITSADTTAIGAFYGRTHNVLPTMLSPNKGLPFKLTLLNTPPIQVGDLVRIQVSLGTAAAPVTNLYGFTFDMSLSPQIVDSVFHMDFKDDSWMAFNAPSLNFQRRPRVGRLETALTRTNGINASGSGLIGEVEFIVIDVIDDTRGKGQTYHATANVTMLDGNGQPASLGDVLLELPISTGNNGNQPTAPVKEADLNASPNPASDYVSLYLNGDNQIENLRILDVSGKEVWNSGPVVWKSADVPVRDLDNGTYFFHATTANGKVVKKITVVR